MNCWEILTHANSWIAFCCPMILFMAFSGVHFLQAMRSPNEEFKAPKYIKSKYFWFGMLCASLISAGLTIALLRANIVFPKSMTWTISITACFLIVKAVPMKKNNKEND